MNAFTQFMQSQEAGLTASSGQEYAAMSETAVERRLHLDQFEQAMLARFRQLQASRQLPD